MIQREYQETVETAGKSDTNKNHIVSIARLFLYLLANS